MWMMDLSREFYEQIGKPALEAAVPVLSGRYAAGLVGYGSECFGFDDEISADHDYGPGFCVWLTKRDYERYGQRLKEVYAGLPDTFLGMKVKKMPERAGIFEIEEFYRMLYIPNTNPQNWMEWLRLPEEKLALETRRSQTDRLSRACNDTLLNCEREVTRLEGKLNSSTLEEKQILDKLWERYELSHSDAQALRVELESIPKATRRIAELNREIKGLGPINIGAIEEFDRVNTRYTYLSDQRNDVEKAKEELLGIIEEITKQMTEIFATQFEILKQSFQETFLELFGGGRATLELEDENDILRCGIEIKAQPPGKQLKTLSLLSGGEKAFVAIALYFAILKVHPTPFCVMDEIEAALDESNVVRYARYMRRIAGKTQFIVITHRRGTMEEADVLYGVTMQERGVSQVLAVDLNAVETELHLNAT